MKLLAVLLNYKTAPMTEKALDALLVALEPIPSSRVCIVDNDSQDGSFERLKQAVAERGVGDRVDVVETGYNGGFGYGNNYAMRKALQADAPPEFIYLLNSDAFPAKDAVTRLLQTLEADARVGIAGSYIHGPDGEPHQTAFRFPTALSELEEQLRLGVVSKLLSDHIVALPIPEVTREVDWLAGASMMMKSAMLEEIGLFDERFFLYYEETDLCRRAQLAGWRTVYVRDSHVAHIGSVSTGMKENQKPTPRFWFASRRHYFQKNHGARYRAAADVAHVVGAFAWRLRRRIQNKPDVDRPRALRDFVVHALSPGTDNGAPKRR
jgi:N-acetylglucosaminyl-diphospho-decaprenol L-rhamnosyltransferase